MTAPAGPFALVGSVEPLSPIIVSVPHGGRIYPAAMRPLLRVAPDRLALLEDRHVDTLARAACGAETMVIALHGRCWIDLNRGEDERDPLLERGADMRYGQPPGAKVRSGLGLIPRRTAATGDIWRGRLQAGDVAVRIAGDHRPYHAALAALVGAARRRFGIAVLVDVHSMPALGEGADAPRLVVGDRFGRTASARFAERMMVEARQAGIAAAVNAPYAGGHVVTRHGSPDAGMHALQIEIDRTLYLDAAQDRPGPGFAGTARLLRHLLDALADEALAMPDRLPIAAE